MHFAFSEFLTTVVVVAILLLLLHVLVMIDGIKTSLCIELYAAVGLNEI